MLIFLKLFFAHCIGDFVLQPDHWISDKIKHKAKSSKLYLHVGIHFLLMTIILYDWKYFWPIVLVTASHLIIDLWKLHFQDDKNFRMLFFIDQVLHILFLAAFAQYYESFLSGLSIDKGQLILLALATLLVTSVSSKVVKLLISKWTPETEDDDEDSLSNAGSYIGILERLFVFGFVVSGNIEAVGFLLAAKSVFRFGDLKESKDRKLTEYMLIGSLLSFGMAILIGVIYLEMSNKLPL